METKILIMRKKRLTTRHSIVTITLFIFFFAGCKKSSSPPPRPSVITLEFPPAGLEYVNLTPGKYLIYKDSASGILDSVVITKSQLETKYSPGDTVIQGGVPVTYPAIYSQEFSLTLTKVDSISQTPWFTGSAANEAPIVSLLLYEMYHLVGISTEYAGLVFSDPTFPIFSTIPSITIEGQNYTNVILGEYEHLLLDDNDPDYTKRTFYWAKGIGIIKREIITTGGAIQTHTLIRHN